MTRENLSRPMQAKGAASASAGARSKPAPMSADISFSPRVYYLSGDGHVRQLAWQGDHFQADDLFPLVINPPPNGMPLADLTSGIATMGVGGNPRIYYLSDPAGIGAARLQELAWTGSSMQITDLHSATAGQNPQLAATGTGLAAMAYGPNGDPRIYYLDMSLNFQQMAWLGNRWDFSPVSAAVANPPAGGVPPPDMNSGFAAIGCMASIRPPHIFYLDASGNVQHIGWHGGQWKMDALPAGPPAVVRTRVAAMATGTNADPHVFYLDRQNRIQHMALVSDVWVRDDPDPIAMTGSPPANAEWGSMLAVMGTGGNLDPSVFYVTTTDQVQCLAWYGNTWVGKNLTNIISPPGPVGPSIVATGAGVNRDPRIYYFVSGGQVLQLAWIGDTPFPEGDDFWAAPFNVTTDPTTTNGPAAAGASSSPLVAMGAAE